VDINRRQFVKSSAIGAGLFVLEGCGSSGGSSQQDNLSETPVLWREVVSWDHSWDAADAITYSDDGKGYGLDPAVRVDYVPDQNGGIPLRRDNGAFSESFSIPRIPGPLYQSSNTMFGGRESWYADIIIPHNPEQPKYFYTWSSMLHTASNFHENVFFWEQPWWGAVLVRGVRPFDGHNSTYIDGNPGMVTIERSEKNDVSMRVWPDGSSFGPTIYSDVKFTEDTVLVQWLANGEDSWLELNYKNKAGEIISSRTQGAVSNTVMQNLHSGLSHTHYMACMGIAKGVPDTVKTDAVRDWAAPYIPVAIEL
jgi:hypothetical protein